MVTPASSSPVSPSLPVLSASSVPAWPLPGETEPTGFAPNSHVRGHKAAAPCEPAPLPEPRSSALPAPLRRLRPLGSGPSQRWPLRAPCAPRACTASPPSPAPPRPPNPPPGPCATGRLGAQHPPQGAPRSSGGCPPSPRRPGRQSLTPVLGPAAPRPEDKSYAAAAPPAAPRAATAGDREGGRGWGDEEEGEEGEGSGGGAAAAQATRLPRPRPKPPPPARHTPGLVLPGPQPENLPQGTRVPPLGGRGERKRKGRRKGDGCVHFFFLITIRSIHPRVPRAILGKCQTLPHLYNSGRTPTYLLSMLAHLS